MVFVAWEGRLLRLSRFTVSAKSTYTERKIEKSESILTERHDVELSSPCRCRKAARVIIIHGGEETVADDHQISEEPQKFGSKILLRR